MWMDVDGCGWMWMWRAVLQDAYALGKRTSHWVKNDSSRGNRLRLRVTARSAICKSRAPSSGPNAKMNAVIAIASGAPAEALADEMEVSNGAPPDLVAPGADPVAGQAAVGAHEVVEPIEAPSYLYTPDGIFFVPHWYIERDKNMPVLIKASMWKEMQQHHGKFTAVNFLCTTTVRAENIVAMTLINPENPHGRYKRCHWFVRIAVHGGSKMFKETFGANFLWQLPYGTCTKIVQEIKAYEATNNVPHAQSSALVGILRPTSQDIVAKEWRDLQPVSALDGYYDKLFAMSVKPIRRTVALPKDNPRPILDRITRPPAFQTPRRSRLDFSKFPDDLCMHIFGIASTRWLNSHESSDWSALLALRAVSRSTKAIVEEGAERVLNEMLLGVKNALVSGNVAEITKVRDRILDTGLTTLSFVLDTNNPKFVNLARLRTNRKPGTMPPPKPPPSLKRQNTICYNIDSDDYIQDRLTDKSVQRIQFEKDNAFIRRQMKRRRILTDRNKVQ